MAEKKIQLLTNLPPVPGRAEIVEQAHDFPRKISIKKSYTCVLQMSLKIPFICSPVIAFGEHIHIDTGLYTYTHIYIHMVLSTFTVGSSLEGTHSNMLPDQL